MKLSRPQQRLLIALRDGWRLKSHRDIEGSKVFRLHPLEGPPVDMRRATVESLVRLSLIGSNQKFPAATYWLTDQGHRVAASLAPCEYAPPGL